MHDGLKGAPNNQILTSIERYGRIISAMKAKDLQLDNFHQQCQTLDKEIKELQTRNEDLRLILQRTEGELAAVTSAHFNVQSKLRLEEEELSKIKECLPTQHSESETDLISRIKALLSFKPKLEAECEVLRRDKGEIRRKLESQLREVNNEKTREIDKMKSEHDHQIQEHEDTIKQLQKSLDDQASPANVKLQVEKARLPPRHDSRIQVFVNELKTIVDEIRAMNELVREYTEEGKGEARRQVFALEVQVQGLRTALRAAKEQSENLADDTAVAVMSADPRPSQSPLAVASQPPYVDEALRRSVRLAREAAASAEATATLSSDALEREACPAGSAGADLLTVLR